MSIPAHPARHGAALIFALCLIIVVSCAQLSHAAVMVYDTPAGATLSSKPVDAVVDFTTSADTVHIVLRNLQADPKLDTECLSGLRFHLSSGQNTGMLTSSSGIDRSITSGGAYSDAAAPVSTGWSLL